MDPDRRKQRRRRLLRKIIDCIESGNFNNTVNVIDNVPNELGKSRQTYHDPSERSGFNYGYMEMDEVKPTDG